MIETSPQVTILRPNVQQLDYHTIFTARQHSLLY